MKTTYVYRADKNGCVRGIPSNQRIPHIRGESVESFEQRIQKTLYGLECEQGSRFNGAQEFSPSMLKKVWVDNVERDNARDARRDAAMARKAQCVC